MTHLEERDDGHSRRRSGDRRWRREEGSRWVSSLMPCSAPQGCDPKKHPQTAAETECRCRSSRSAVGSGVVRAGEPFPRSRRNEASPADPASVCRRDHASKLTKPNIRIVPPVQTQEAAHEIPRAEKTDGPVQGRRSKSARARSDEPVILRRSSGTGVYRRPSTPPTRGSFSASRRIEDPRVRASSLRECGCRRGTSTVARNIADGPQPGRHRADSAD